MAPKRLVTVELRFVTGEDVDQLADRLRESAAIIVGRDALEEFRVRTLPLEGPRGGKGKLRSVE